jgi:hypothetical protein
MYIAKRTRRTWIDLLKLCWVLSSGVSFLWFMLRLPYIGVVESKQQEGPVVVEEGGNEGEVAVPAGK